MIYYERDAKDGNPGWERIGSNVCYYRNFFVRGGQNFKYYFTATFTIRFSYANDTCYIAYHYPYTATMLNVSCLFTFEKRFKNNAATCRSATDCFNRNY